MKYYVTAHRTGMDKPIRLAYVIDPNIGLSLIRGLLPNKIYVRLEVWSDETRGRSKKPATAHFVCRHDLDSGKWVICEASGANAVLESGIL